MPVMVAVVPRTVPPIPVSVFLLRKFLRKFVRIHWLPLVTMAEGEPTLNILPNPLTVVLLTPLTNWINVLTGWLLPKTLTY